MAPTAAEEEERVVRKKAASGLSFTRSADPWHGVSLGGWLLLEPGPSDPLFERHPDPKTEEEARCEWDLMQILRAKLGDEGAMKVIQQHRETHITKRDFERIRLCGLNAVRLPFGYWVVLGPTRNDPYAGPGLEFVDRAIDWAEECGLQVVLDLHGCPGGESGEAPCGRRQRPHGTWQWQDWDMDLSLKALEVLCRRYSSRSCVTGVAVCNEPSNETPLTRLCTYYGRAIETIRRCGMPASRVAAVLPVFQRPEDKFAKKWKALFGDKHKNFCFDVHCYHCFENEFNGKTFAQQLRHVQANQSMLREYPMVVGEWSLALGQATWATCGKMTESDVQEIFGRAQAAAFREASHGHFFWNWTERPDAIDWNFQLAFEKGCLTGPPPQLPDWNGQGEDPLEELCNPSPCNESRIFYGEKVCLRVFYGRYMDVWGAQVNAQWPDKGAWQSFVFCPVAGRSGIAGRREVKHGDVVYLRANNGRYLTVGRDLVVRASKAAGPAERFIVHLRHRASALHHRGVVCLESKSTRTMLDADDAEDGIFARYSDFGDWQQFAVEKVVPRSGGAVEVENEGLLPPTPKNRRQCHTGSALFSLKAGVTILEDAPPATKRRRLMEKSAPSSTPLPSRVAGSPSLVLDTSPGKLSVDSDSTKAPSLSDTPMSLASSASSNGSSTRKVLLQRAGLLTP